MAAVMRVMAAVLMAVIPGGLLVFSAFVLARLVANRVRSQQGPHRLSQAVASIAVRDVWNETRRSLL